MTNRNHYDVIVLGLGVMGSAAAYHLTRAGQRVLALEQFDLDHQNGSSYGVSRIIRYAYDAADYVELAKAAYPLWRDLEAQTGTRLLYQTGGLDFGRADEPTLLAVRDSLDQASLGYEWLAPAAVQQRFPQFHLDDDMMAVYQPDAGYLAASDCVLTMVNAATSAGATVKTQARVTNCEVHGDAITIETTSESYSAARIIITAGAWTAQILGLLDLQVPLLPTREQLVFFDPPDAALFAPERFPVFVQRARTLIYGIPDVAGSGLKAGIHGSGQAVNPDDVNREVETDYIDRVRGFVQRYLPQGVGPVKDTRTCLYTMTPDEDFIIDRHPAYPHVIFGAGFSGHGFKFGVLIGKILTDLALQGTTAHNIRRFKVDRFLTV